jgi:crotonobetainyl-CoA:carnitine CoA-transferase CaiB-like acyl-CoA transferase
MLPLEGIKVIEMGIWAFAPAAAVALADWGAEVIKIEDPATGDPMRNLESSVGARAPTKYSVYEVNNRNKRSMALNLASEKGRQIFYDMIKQSDVFVSNYRAAALERLKADYESLSKVNPRLIYAMCTGYGINGDEKDKAGYDTGAYWARCGLMVQLGQEGSSPAMLYPGLGDQPSGQFCAGGIALALYARERTGKGQKVDVSLIRSGVWVTSLASMMAMELGFVPRLNRQQMGNPLVNCYKCKDDNWLMLLMLQPDRYWSDLCRAMGLQHLENDPKFCNITSRGANNVEIIAIMDKVFQTKTRCEWIEIFKGYNILWDPGNTFADMVNDAQVNASGAFLSYEHPTKGTMRVPATPIDINNIPFVVRRHAPEFGENTEEILLEFGYSWEDIAELKESGAIL